MCKVLLVCKALLWRECLQMLQDCLKTCNCKVMMDCNWGLPQILHILQSSGLAGLQSLHLQYWSSDMPPTQCVSLSPLSALTCLNKFSIDFPLDTTHQVFYVISDLDGLSPSVVEVKISSRSGDASLRALLSLVLLLRENTILASDHFFCRPLFW